MSAAAERVESESVLEKLRALRVMCEASGQPFYVEILTEAIDRLTLPAEPTKVQLETRRHAGRHVPIDDVKAVLHGLAMLERGRG